MPEPLSFELSSSTIVSTLAETLRLAPNSVRATLGLLDSGATVPFIARYRKEQTGGLDEVAIRAVETHHTELVALEDRRRTVLSSVEQSGNLTPQLRGTIEACRTRAELEDVYLPYRPKRKTRASIARERGLEPLAKRILAQSETGDPRKEAAVFVDSTKGIPDVETALAGARDIAAELLAERRDIRAVTRARFEREGVVVASAIKAKTTKPTKFEAYYDYSERTKTIPSHRWLALVRGESEGILRVKIQVDETALGRDLAACAGLKPRSAFAKALEETITDAVRRLLLPSIESDVRTDLKARAHEAAAHIFAENLGKLLLAPPLGHRVVLGIDPGQRTGCKCVVVDNTGKLLRHTVIHLVTGEAALRHAERTLRELIATYSPFAIAVGNGTHGRETADFCRQVLRELKQEAALGDRAEVLVVLVSEAGASVYSASDVAREELPDVDLTVRGAVSIARRLQDPLAELVKIDPKAIGVGQYQHDVDPKLLERKLDDVVESCVSAVGVELSTASPQLLAYVPGIGPALGKKIVAHRQARGAFRSRNELLEVAGLGRKAFEQAAGFVRIRDSVHPLDASAVHPERYALVDNIAKNAGVATAALIGNEALLAQIPWASYVSADVGMPTLDDIRHELSKPGRDPRDTFEAPRFRDDIRSIDDVTIGMMLDGVVTNVTAFGAFVDLGLKQDGLVHVSELADHFVRDPSAIVRVGDRITVRVLAIDVARNRISLSRRTAKSN